MPKRYGKPDAESPEWTREEFSRAQRVGDVFPMTKATTRVQELEALCAELYQVLGTVGAPAAVLEKVWAAAAGQPIPRVELLPIGEDAFEAVRARQVLIDAVRPRTHDA